MSAPFSVTSVSNYNVNPPSDDGATTTQNQLKWSNHKTKLADPIKTAFDASETATLGAFGKLIGGAGVSSLSTDYTVLSGDQGKLLKYTASGKTLTTPDATAVNSPFVFAVLNISGGNITVAGNNPGVQQTIDGSTSLTLSNGRGFLMFTDGTNWFTSGQVSIPTIPSLVPGSFKKLVIKVTSTSQISASADAITVTDGSTYMTLSFSTTIGTGVSGAGGLDNGVMAPGTWYAVWAIAKADTTTSFMLSTSFTSPIMPSGYTFKARVGAVTTASASTNLLGTQQYGRKGQHVVGLAATSALPAIGFGIAGNTAAPTWIAVGTSSTVPPTASIIKVIAACSNGTIIVAPNNSYGASGSTSVPPPISIVTSNIDVIGEIVLESSNIYWASGGSTNSLWGLGWEDNI